MFLLFNSRQFAGNDIVGLNTRETIYQMVDMLQITSTPDLLAEMIMKCPDLRCSVKHVILKDLDDKCQKLCFCSQENSSVLRIPKSNHKVKYPTVVFNGVSKILSCVHLGTG